MSYQVKKIRTNVAAGATNTNLVAGTNIEFPGRPSRFLLAAVGSAAGFRLDVLFGTDLVAETLVVPIEVAANRGPVVPDNVLVKSVIDGSDRLILKAVNTGGAAADIDVLIELEAI